MLRVINVRPFKATLKVKVSAAFRCPDRPYYYPGRKRSQSLCFCNELQKWLLSQPVFMFWKTVSSIWKEPHVYTQTLLLWQFISLKPKVMFPLALKYDYRLWHLSCDFHKTLCLFASRPWKGATVKGRCALIWQFQTFFNPYCKSRTSLGSVKFSFPFFPAKEKGQSSSISKLQHISKFHSALLRGFQVSDYSNVSTPSFTRQWWFRNILTHACHPVSLSFPDLNLSMGLSSPLSLNGPHAVRLTGPNLYSERYQNSH